MKVIESKIRVRGKEYKNYKMSLSKREALILKKLGGEFKIYDYDEKTGEVILKPKKKQFNTTFKYLGDPVCSVRLHVSGEDWVEFKRVVRGKGLTLCWVFSEVVRAVLACPDVADCLVDGRDLVKIVNVFLGSPRSKWERRLWSRRVSETSDRCMK